MKLRNLRPTPGVLIGTIALVFAFTGGAVAASKINTEDIAKKAVTGSRDREGRGQERQDRRRQDQGQGPGLGRASRRTWRTAGSTRTARRVAPETGAVGITGTSSGGAGLICYDLALDAGVGHGDRRAARPAPPTTVELVVAPPGRLHRPVHGRGDGHPPGLERQPRSTATSTSTSSAADVSVRAGGRRQDGAARSFRALTRARRRLSE